MNAAVGVSHRRAAAVDEVQEELLQQEAGFSLLGVKGLKGEGVRG